MRYAVISDVHGNMDALEAVLADARKQGAEGYLFAGDYCLSLPYPEEVIDRIRKIENAVLIRGNEEQYIERMRGEREECWAGGQMHISCWCEQALCEIWSKIRIKELRSRREHLYFFLKYASEYAERTGDTVRPFGKKTWEGAFEEWDRQ